jgi:predicted nucleic acid-binding protein
MLSVSTRPIPPKSSALQWLRQHADTSYLFYAAISAVVMRRLEVKWVAAFDDHFRQVGGFDVIG